jgi:hypothetical protein
MSYYSDLDDDLAADSMAAQEFRYQEENMRNKAIFAIKKALRKLSDEALVERVLQWGTVMNRPGMKFKLYDICKRLRDNGWTPQGRQRTAIINTATIALYDIRGAEAIYELTHGGTHFTGYKYGHEGVVL